MCGGIPRILREQHQGAPACGAICQQMCKAWWGPHLDNMRAQALKIVAIFFTVTFHTKAKSYVIPKSELQLGTLWMVPSAAESGNYERHESKTGIKTVATEWNSLPLGLPLSEEGVWPAPTREEEDALCRVRTDCMDLPVDSKSALRSYQAGVPPPNGQPSGSSTNGNGGAPLNVGHWPVLTWLPSATASPFTRWLLSEEGIQWVYCIIQWLEVIRSISA